MKRIFLAMVALLMAAANGLAETKQAITVKSVEVTGEVKGENVSFTVAARVAVAQAGAILELIQGKVVFTEGALPRGVSLIRTGQEYSVQFAARGDQEVKVSFAVTPERQGEWRRARFTVPGSVIRHLKMTSDRNDLELQFGGAVQVAKHTVAGGGMEAEVFLEPGAPVDVQWKPQVQKLEGELAVACDGRTIAVAGVGALKMNMVFSYRIIQGVMDSATLTLPENLNVTQVTGEDIREWRTETTPTGERLLKVSLSRPKEQLYTLRIEGERVLAAFPCKFDMPVIVPKGVIRASGFLMMGTDSAIKLLVDKSAGLNQIDAASFPKASEFAMAMPTRSVLSYQYAHLPFQMRIAAEDVVTVLTSDDRVTVAYEDNGVTVDATLDVEVREAPTRDLLLETAAGWSVAQVQGAAVSDYDVRDTAAGRQILVTLKEAVLGHTLLTVRMERTWNDGCATFAVPRMKLRDARSERGYVVLRAEKGVRLKEGKADGLTDVHAGSVPFRTPDAQRAYRFKDPEWGLQVLVEQADAAIHAEMFHLVSVGEGALYGSVTLTCRIEGAPVRRFVVKVPATYQNVDFTGRDIRGWEREGDLVTVSLQEKVLGDYTLLITYDQPFAYEGAELTAGGVEAMNAASEVGYVAIAGPASLSFEPESERGATVIPIAAEELPREYALLVNDPVLKAYKSVGVPHPIRMAVRRIGTQALLDHVADHIILQTRVSRDGEAVTEATYYVKNTAQQFLGITLPKRASLWSAKVDNEAVRVLDDGKGMLLVPMKRLLDANTPLRVDLTYAESYPKMTWFSSHTFRSPVSMAQSVFARWELTGPEKLSLLPAGGNMAPPQMPGVGLTAVCRTAWRIVAGVGRAGGGMPAALAVFVLMTIWCAYVIGRKGMGSAAGVGVLAATILIGLIGSVVAMLEMNRVAGAILEATSRGGEVSREVEFTKSVTLSDRELAVQVRVVPYWMGGSGGMVRLLLGVIIGVVIGIGALIRKRKPFWVALGLTVTLWGFAVIPAVVNVAAAGLVVAVPLVYWCALLRGVYRKGAGKRAAVANHVDRDAEMLPPPFATMPTVAEDRADAGTEGGIRIGLLMLMTALAAMPCLAWPWAGTAGVVTPATASDIRSAGLQIEAPDPQREREGIAKLELTLKVDCDKPVSFRVFPANIVLTGSSLDPRWSSLTADTNGYWVTLQKAGRREIKFSGIATVSGAGGVWRLSLGLPPHLKNEVKLTIPSGGWSVSSEQAARLDVADRDGRTTAAMMLYDASDAEIVWQPRERATKLERALFYCDLQTYAVVSPGLLSMTHVARYQIAQGEIQALRYRIPEGSSVTAVEAPGLVTWRFDADMRMVEALLDKPVSGDLAVTLTTQMAREGLPYDVVIMAPTVEGCARQRGSIALAAGNGVQLRVDEASLKGVSRMNVSDFSKDSVPILQKRTVYTGLPEIKLAYRYHELPVSASVHAEQVLPEVRVVEDASLDISDERLVLTSRLAVTINRAGVFDLRLDLPDRFDIETLTGDDVSHWDEVKEGGRGVIVHFNKQALGVRGINVVLGRMEKGVEALVKVPRIGVRDAVKHVGTLAVSGERGVRFLTHERDGVSEVHPKELGIEQPGYLAYRLLRPDWSVALKTETLAPVVRADLLQRADISEGMIHGRCFVQYKIDQAGVKVFRFRSPAKGVSLTVSGRNIAKVSEVDKAQGLWEVELQGKVENRYMLDVSYQQPVDPKAARMDVVPVQTVGADSQKGYIVVFAAGRLQVKASEVPNGLYPDDARSVPGTFGAGDLSDAILCYRTTREDYVLGLSVVRHDSAEMLPARVESVRLTTVESEDGQRVTRAEVRMKVGSLRALETRLPEGSVVWSVFVNGAAVTPLKKDGKLLVPLESVRMSNDAAVELTYATPAGKGHWFGRQRLDGPRFNVPLTDVRWDVYLPSGYRYHGFGGTLLHKPEWHEDGVVVYDYEQETRNATLAYNARAEEVLKKGEDLWKEGKQAQAKQALKEAVVFSQGQQGLNEDARIQYRNLMRQQAVVGFASRRSALKKARNVQEDYGSAQDASANAPAQQVQQGEWTADYGRQVEQQMDAKDIGNLNRVADRLLEQQAAAQVRANPIRITMPILGQHLAFYRELQIHPDSEMAVEFKASSGRWGRLLGAVASGAVVMGLLLAAIYFPTERQQRRRRAGLRQQDHQALHHPEQYSPCSRGGTPQHRHQPQPC